MYGTSLTSSESFLCTTKYPTAITPIVGSTASLVPTPRIIKNGTTVTGKVATNPISYSGKCNGLGTCSLCPFSTLNFFIPCTLKSSTASKTLKIKSAAL